MYFALNNCLLLCKLLFIVIDIYFLCIVGAHFDRDRTTVKIII